MAYDERPVVRYWISARPRRADLLEPVDTSFLPEGGLISSYPEPVFGDVMSDGLRLQVVEAYELSSYEFTLEYDELLREWLRIRDLSPPPLGSGAVAASINVIFGNDGCYHATWFSEQDDALLLCYAQSPDRATWFGATGMALGPLLCDQPDMVVAKLPVGGAINDATGLVLDSEGRPLVQFVSEAPGRYHELVVARLEDDEWVLRQITDYDRPCTLESDSPNGDSCVLGRIKTRPDTDALYFVTFEWSGSGFTTRQQWYTNKDLSPIGDPMPEIPDGWTLQPPESCIAKAARVVYGDSGWSGSSAHEYRLWVTGFYRGAERVETAPDGSPCPIDGEMMVYKFEVSDEYRQYRHPLGWPRLPSHHST